MDKRLVGLTWGGRAGYISRSELQANMKRMDTSYALEWKTIPNQLCLRTRKLIVVTQYQTSRSTIVYLKYWRKINYLNLNGKKWNMPWKHYAISRIYCSNPWKWVRNGLFIAKSSSKHLSSGYLSPHMCVITRSSCVCR